MSSDDEWCLVMVNYVKWWWMMSVDSEQCLMMSNDVYICLVSFSYVKFTSNDFKWCVTLSDVTLSDCVHTQSAWCVTPYMVMVMGLHRYVHKVRKLHHARYKCNNKRDPEIINVNKIAISKKAYLLSLSLAGIITR